MVIIDTINKTLSITGETVVLINGNEGFADLIRLSEMLDKAFTKSVIEYCLVCPPKGAGLE